MTTSLIAQTDFTEITKLIIAAHSLAVQAVNTALIDLYWKVGQTITQKIAQAQWGDGVVALLAAHLVQTQPELHELYLKNAPGDDAAPLGEAN